MRGAAALASAALLLALIFPAGRATPEPLPRGLVLERAKFIVFLIPHSHWDPDWLMPWSQSRDVVKSIIESAVRLAELQGDFRYVADQVCFLRDYWERQGGPARGELREAVAKGLIEVAGGMVSQPDTVLPSEPGLLWDVFLGHTWVMGVLGVEPSPVAWQCDPFGHAPTLPELLVASGYRYVYIGRVGEGQEGWLPHAFYWVGPTGAKVLAFFRGYCDGEFLARARSAGEVRDRLLEIVREAVSRDGINATILLVGCDFTQPPSNLVNLVNEWNRVYLDSTGVGLVIATPSEAFKFIEERYGGRLREIRLDPNPLWQGWYLTRPAAKLAERRASFLLSTVTKLLPLAELAGLNATAIAERASEAWFKLCMNHHHDSITATSPDSTWNQSIWPRYARALDEAQGLFNETLAALAGAVGGRSPSSVVVFNPSARVRRGVVLVNVTLPRGLAKLAAVEPGGAAHPVQVLAARALNSTHAEYELAVETGYVPPLGYKALELVEGEVAVPAPATASLSGDYAVLENAYARLVVNLRAGGFIEELVDKVSGRRVLERGSGEVVYYRDWGDVYGFSLGSAVASSRGFRVSRAEVVWSGPLVAKLRVELSGAARLTLEYTMYYDERGFDLTLTVAALKDTTATLTLRGPSGRFISSVPFGAVERPLDNRFWPVSYWFSIEGVTGPSLAVINRGAAQGVRRYLGVLEIGLVRDCSTPKQDKITFTDQEPHTLELRFLLYEGGWREGLVWLSAYDFNYPLVAVARPPAEPKLPPQLGLLSANGGSELVDVLPLSLAGEPAAYLLVFSNPLASAFNTTTSMDVSSAQLSLVDGRARAQLPLRVELGAKTFALGGAVPTVKLNWTRGFSEVRRERVELRMESVSVEEGGVLNASARLTGPEGPLAGEVVELWGRSGSSELVLSRALTDSSGVARFKLEVNASGSLQVFARFAGSLLYEPAESAPVAVRVQPRYRFSIVVTDRAGEPLASAYVSVTGEQVSFRAYTDEAGRAEFLLPPGSYTVRVLYRSAQAEQRVSVEGAGEVRVVLEVAAQPVSAQWVWAAAAAALAALLVAALLERRKRFLRGRAAPGREQG